MANENQSNNRIRIRATSAPNGITVSSSDTKRALEVTNNDARYYSDLAKKYKDEAKALRDDAKYYAEQNSDVTMLYVNTLEARLQGQIDGKQPTGDYALNSAIPANVSSLNNDSQYVNSTQLGAAIDSVRLPSQTGHDGEFLYTSGENPSWKGINELCAFDVIEKDHILSYSESKGYVQIGEYAYKEAVAGSHYGYPDFYSKCLEEYNNPDNTLEIIKNNYTVVGSPTITSDGIASGFTENNYLKIPSMDLSKPFDIKIEFVTGNSLGSVQNIFGFTINEYGFGLGNNTTGNISYVIPTSSSTVSITGSALSTNTKYYCECIYDGSEFIAKLGTSKDNLQIDITTQSGVFGTTTAQNIGVSRSGTAPFKGSIDLKQFSITVDGQPVLTGNQTGIDTIKPDDYTVVGSPTISADGVVSGFSVSNYLKTPVINLDTYNYIIEFEFTTPNQITSAYHAILSGSTSGQNIIALGIHSTGDLLLGLSSNGTSWDMANDTNLAPLNINTKYKFKLVFNGTQYIPYLNGVQLTPISNTNKIYNASSTILNLGIHRNLINYFEGSIDLNAFKIYVDGDLVYQPCLKIPYTLSNTNKKVVDTAYRSRVQDMYEQFGYAPYYMSDTYHEVITYRAVDCIRTNPNGHKYYDISNKSEIDDIYDDLGEAWYYGVDTVNERLLLPRTSNINNGKYLYMVTGNTPDWTGVTEVVNQGATILNQVNTGISNAIAARLDLDVTNVSSAGKNNLMEMLMPDYSSGITISSGYEAVFYGFVVVYGAASDQQRARCYVNGELVGYNWNGAQGGQDGYSYRFYVSPGDVITWDSTYTPAVVKIYPLKGVSGI